MPIFLLSRRYLLNPILDIYLFLLGLLTNAPIDEQSNKRLKYMYSDK